MPNILPGPWHLEFDTQRDSYMVYDAPPNEDGEVFMTIAEVHVGERESSVWHQPSHARLIAAAPELLAVCQAIANDLSLFQFTDGEYRLSEQSASVILQSLREVIARAEGRSE